MIKNLSKRASKLGMDLFTYLSLFEEGAKGKHFSFECPIQRKAFNDGKRYRKKLLDQEARVE
tara:strand:- start:1269 stop:1454 length:186 start_codon:yes stop_codon:yes gene_type:complete